MTRLHSADNNAIVEIQDGLNTIELLLNLGRIVRDDPQN